MKIELWMSNELKNTQLNLHVFIFLKKCQGEKQKTEIDCQIYKMRMRLENSFAPNLFMGRKIVKNFFAIVFPLKLCNCVKKFVSLS